MGGIIQADADDLGRPGHRRRESDPGSLQGGSSFAILCQPGFQAGEAVIAEEVLIPVFAKGGGIENGIIIEEEARRG